MSLTVVMHLIIKGKVVSKQLCAIECWFGGRQSLPVGGGQQGGHVHGGQACQVAISQAQQRYQQHR